MLCVGWDRNEVALLAQEGEDFLVLFFFVKPKESLAFNKDTHFILGVSMFSEEFLSDSGQIRRIPVYIDISAVWYPPFTMRGLSRES